MIDTDTSADVMTPELVFPPAAPALPAPADTPNLPTPDGGRDTSGRFAPGNTFSRGNGVGRQVARYRARLRKAIGDKFTELADRLVSEALKGRRWALTLALAYLAGRPEEMTEERLQALEEALLSRRDHDYER